MNILITGAGNGLGHAFAEAFSDNPDVAIYAIDRVFIKSLNLNAKAKIRPTELDITNEASVSAYGHELAHELSQNNQKLDLVIHSAGVRGLVPSVKIESSDDVAKAETIETMDAPTMLKTYEINALGTFQIIKTLLPLLRSHRIESTGGTGVKRPSKVIVMGSRMGSIASNTTKGGAYAYRASKAAVNAIVKSFAIDVPEVLFAVVHPGRVETGLVSVKEDGALSVEESVSDIQNLIDKLRPDQSGSFLDRFGNEMPW